MLSRIALFELRYHLRAPLLYVAFAIFFLLSFGSVVIDEIRIGGRGNVNFNSPYAILQTLAIMNVFGIFIVTAFVANAVIRDDETNFASILRATRITKLDYLVGRFIGAIAVAFVIIASVPLGMLVGSWMPWVDSEKIGPFVISHYLYALFIHGLPTLLVIGAGFFALATATRSMMWTYVGAVAFLALFFISRVFLRDSSMDFFSAMVDPFGIGALSQVTKYWTAAERNTQLPALSGLLLYNRLLWIGIAFVLFAIAYAVFRFEVKGARMDTGAKAAAAGIGPGIVAGGHQAGALVPLPDTSSDRATRWQQLAALTRFDMRLVFKSPAFFVLLAIGIVNAYGGMYLTLEFRGTEYFPVTRVLVQALQGTFSIIPLIVAIYYSGELVWSDRERRLHEIVDSTAAPDWAFIIPKVLAITLVLLASYVIAMITGIVFQLTHAYTHVQPMAYLLWFIVPGAISSLLLAMLAIFVQTLSPHKFVGWAVMLVYIVATLTLASVGFEHNLYHYAGATEVPLSDMNGMGRFWIGRAWFQLYWLIFALMLGVLSYALWRRGVGTALKPRLRRLPLRLKGPAGGILAVAAVAWAGVGAWIFYNTNVQNDYRTQKQEERLAADYEKTLLSFESVPQPRIIDIKLAVDLHPTEVVNTDGVYTIENRTAAPLPGGHVRWARPLAMRKLDVEGGTLEREYKEFDYRIYRFATPMQPGEKRTIRFSSVLEERGFPNARPTTRIVGNGTFVNNVEIAPILGMSRDRLLQDRAKRRKYGLPSELRPPKLEDDAATANHYLRHDSDFVTGEITLTTDADQVPIAPGTTVSDSVTGDRRTIVTRTEAPIHNFFSMQSARYSMAKDQWSGADGKKIDLAVYYDPAHPDNVERMLKALKISLDTFNTAFSPYQFHQLRIIEFPAYASFAQAFAATIPYSEGIGFIQNHKSSKEDEKIDLVTYVTAHEVAHQWWAHQVIGADKQGSTMLSESFAQYSALLVMEKLYGPEMIRKFLKGELDAYLRSRGAEVIEELPLNRDENQQYIHYRKGSLVMYWLKEVVGVEVVNRALQRLLEQYAFKPAPYPSSTDFIRLLREEAGPPHEQLIADLFERITLYDMKATGATMKKLGEGKFEVRFDVEGKKLYADGKGNESEAPLDEPFDIGVFADEPGKKGYKRESVLFFERRPIRSGKQTIVLVVDKPPKFVGVDPFNKRIDRNSEDNLIRVEVE